MRILLLSDTHQDTDRIDEVLNTCGKIDMIIHCGDMERDFDYLTYTAPQDVAKLTVCGNNEWQSELPFFRVVQLEGVRFYVTHGHKERVKRDYSELLRKARMNDCQVALFGHTHKKAHEMQDGIHLINPGALCYPFHSYAILSVSNGKVKADFFSLI